MILVLTAISDFVILNSSVSLNRNINELFDSLKKVKGKLSGKNLFKSTLEILLRDVDLDAEEDSLVEFEAFL